jgi:hypothetical protein
LDVVANDQQPQVLQTVLVDFIQPDAAGRTVSYLIASALFSAMLRRCAQLDYPNPDRGRETNFRKHAKCMLQANIHPELSDSLAPGDIEGICHTLTARCMRLSAAALALQWVMTARIVVVEGLEPQHIKLEGGKRCTGHSPLR